MSDIDTGEHAATVPRVPRTTDPVTGGPCLLRVTNVSKTFPGLMALDNVSLEVASGEVVAVLGQNGSGKSTLVKILDNLQPADPGGTVEFLDAPSTGTKATLQVIHQDLGLVADLDTLENLDIGRGRGLRGLLPFRRSRERSYARDLLAQFKVTLDVNARIESLSAAEKSVVAIVRALDGWDKRENVLVLDEPTAALHRNEVDILFDVVRRVASNGAGVIFISHRLDEVMQLADRVVVLRDGVIVADDPIDQVTETKLVNLIAGRELAQTDSLRDHAKQPATTRPVLEVNGLAGETVRDLSFQVHRGEIVGIAGLLGSGREHVGGLIFGAHRRTSGDVLVNGSAVPPASPRQAIRQGVASVPPDRHTSGAVMEMYVRENITLPNLSKVSGLLAPLRQSAERADVRPWIAKVDLRPPNPERELRTLSGGNQQKVVLAKWLRNDPQLLILDEPTQGVDVGAKASIYDLVVDAAEDGRAVVVVSSDVKELAMICDRVIVLREGVLGSEIAGAELSTERILRETLGWTEPTESEEPNLEMQR